MPEMSVDYSNGVVVAASHQTQEVCFVASMNNDEGDPNNSTTSNRWPHQETLALLKIRSDMDIAFRESTLKSPLWDVVSRKLAEVGYHRSANKCKEKFENIYKYHKRTKEGRATKRGGKSYRFSNELEALNQKPSLEIPISSSPPINITSIHDLIFTSSTGSSGEESEGVTIDKKKKKLSDFFDNLMKEVIQKQDKLEKKLLETMEKRENERIAREEAWRVKEMARINKNYEILIQQRLVAMARETSIIELLNNFPQQSSSEKFTETTPLLIENIGYNPNPKGLARWPKPEVDALIELRTKLDHRYQENMGRGPMWEAVSIGMKKLGYKRSAKRCKEKWENINKYFKKVKERNKIRRPKACPYFDQLDALYKDKMDKISGSLNPSYGLKAEHLVMNRPERQQGGGSSDTHLKREEDKHDNGFNGSCD